MTGTSEQASEEDPAFMTWDDPEFAEARDDYLGDCEIVEQARPAGVDIDTAWSQATDALHAYAEHDGDWRDGVCACHEDAAVAIRTYVKARGLVDPDPDQPATAGARGRPPVADLVNAQAAELLIDLAKTHPYILDVEAMHRGAGALGRIAELEGALRRLLAAQCGPTWDAAEGLAAAEHARMVLGEEPRKPVATSTLPPYGGDVYHLERRHPGCSAGPVFDVHDQEHAAGGCDHRHAETPAGDARS